MQPPFDRPLRPRPLTAAPRTQSLRAPFWRRQDSAPEHCGSSVSCLYSV